LRIVSENGPPKEAQNFMQEVSGTGDFRDDDDSLPGGAV
jgi:hypothetical protein